MLENAEGRAPCLVLCDHATNRVPRRLRGLGLSTAELERHIAHDIGALAVSQRLSALLDAPLLWAGYSRLVIDPNRHLADPTSIPLVSDGTFVPGNEDLSEADRALRAEALFWPYHRLVEGAISESLRRGQVPLVVGVHSFTPVYEGVARPWDLGLLTDTDRRATEPLLAYLRQFDDSLVGDNEPYSATSPRGYTFDVHVLPQGLPHVLIELRQDLIADAAGAAAWANRLAPGIKELLARPDLLQLAPQPLAG